MKSGWSIPQFGAGISGFAAMLVILSYSELTFAAHLSLCILAVGVPLAAMCSLIGLSLSPQQKIIFQSHGYFGILGDLLCIAGIAVLIGSRSSFAFCGFMGSILFGVCAWMRIHWISFKAGIPRGI